MQVSIIESVHFRLPRALTGTFSVPLTNCEEAWRWVESRQRLLYLWVGGDGGWRGGGMSSEGECERIEKIGAMSR